MAPGRWFDTRGWRPHDFQREVWAALARGESGLLHATTGSGKTLAGWLGALQRARPGPGLQVLWITPMRALASNTPRALAEPLALLQPAWRVAQRSGDTPAAERTRQEKHWPQALVTTPESLSLMLSRASAHADLSAVHTVVVDEWHELIASKHGVQVHLALARLKRWNPCLVTWGLSATIGNLEEAMATLVGDGAGTLVRGRLDKARVSSFKRPRGRPVTVPRSRGGLRYSDLATVTSRKAALVGPSALKKLAGNLAPSVDPDSDGAALTRGATTPRLWCGDAAGVVPLAVEP